jgi:antagonist of KipI
MLATIQDRGRPGFQAFGIPLSGAMDEWAIRTGNIICGNAETEASIEFTLHGAELLVEQDTMLAFCGSGSRVLIDDEEIGFGKIVRVKAYTLLRLLPSNKGYRTYLSIAGGFKVPEIMKSKSTYSPAKLGGVEGKPLQPGTVIEYDSKECPCFSKIKDSLPLRDRNFNIAHWGITSIHSPNYENKDIRVIPGPEWNCFSSESQARLFQSSFVLSEQSNRMGYRFQGQILAKTNYREILSTAVSRGTLQVTHDGNLVLLMADAQTTGGYPRIGQVSMVDLPICAQLRPGDSIRFIPISIEEAEKLYLDREKELKLIKQNIITHFNL